MVAEDAWEKEFLWRPKSAAPLPLPLSRFSISGTQFVIERLIAEMYEIKGKNVLISGGASGSGSFLPPTSRVVR